MKTQERSIAHEDDCRVSLRMIPHHVIIWQEQARYFIDGYHVPKINTLLQGTGAPN